MELKPGEALTIGDVVVTLEAKSGQVARLSIVADKSVQVARVAHPASVAAIASGGIAHKPF
jgi:sRNA-binding carbon storage regulator CsrA